MVTTRTRIQKKKKIKVREKRVTGSTGIPKFKFRVVSGRHHELVDGPKGRKKQVTFLIGDTVLSYRRLDKLFGDKFRFLGTDTFVGEETKFEAPAKVVVEEPDEEDTNDDDNDEVNASYKMKHKGGGRWIVVPVDGDTGEEVGEPVHDGYLNKTAALDLLASLEA